MVWPEGAQLIQQALWVALWVGLPVVGAAVLAGLVAAHLQNALGHSDPAALTVPRLVGAVVGLLFFGSWMMVFLTRYWHWLWSQAAALVGA